jgi:hypothetical protein
MLHLGVVEKFLTYDLSVTDRIEADLVHLHSLSGRLARHVVLESDDKPVPMGPGARHRGGMNLVICEPPLVLSLHSSEALYFLLRTRHCNGFHTYHVIREKNV